jgi:hypothetical protein
LGYVSKSEVIHKDDMVLIKWANTWKKLV